MQDESQPEIDVTTPSVARMYDFALDGKDNYEVDRAAVDELIKIAPSTRPLAQGNRRFLQRAVRWLAEEHGIRQFLDHGSGLPTQDNVHQVAQRVNPDSRVVYVDNDPIVLAHGRALLHEDDRTVVLQADMRNTEEIFGNPEARRLLDLNEPVAALFVSVMHCLSDPDPNELLARTVERLPSGSFLVINQLVSEHAEMRESFTRFVQESTQGNWGRVREISEVERYFDGLEIVRPGLGWINDWRPDSDLGPRQQTHEWYEFGGVARKP